MRVLINCCGFKWHRKPFSFIEFMFCTFLDQLYIERNLIYYIVYHTLFTNMKHCKKNAGFSIKHFTTYIHEWNFCLTCNDYYCLLNVSLHAYKHIYICMRTIIIKNNFDNMS